MCSLRVKNLLDVKFSSSKPLLFVIESSVVRVIDFRALREAAPIEGGYRQLCYVDSLDQLVLVKGHQLYSVYKFEQ